MSAIVVGLLDFFIQHLLRILHHQLPVPDIDTGGADTVTNLKAVEQRDTQAEPDRLTPVILQLVAERKIRIFAITGIMVIAVAVAGAENSVSDNNLPRATFSIFFGFPREIPAP